MHEEQESFECSLTNSWMNKIYLVVQGVEMQPKLSRLPSVKGGGRGGALAISATVAIVCHWVRDQVTLDICIAIVCHWARDQVTLDIAMFDESHDRYV